MHLHIYGEGQNMLKNEKHLKREKRYHILFVEQQAKKIQQIGNE